MDLPPFLAAKKVRPVPFSRLTLTAQLEVLRCDTETSWNACRPLNPFLDVWRARAQTQTLRKTPWPASASRRLGGPAYAARFHRMLRRKSPPVSSSAATSKESAPHVLCQLGEAAPASVDANKPLSCALK